MSKEYYLGLDMGTSSVGWAVTDNEYRIVRAKGKDLWGIREFEEAQTSVARRTNRVSRRRRQREVARIGLLKLYFHDAITAIDSNFFNRLDNSKYYLEDKDDEVKTKAVLFNDPGYKDADYFKQYPTIYHLRKELLYSTDPKDVRLVFLAVLNMFKHRGHFLNSGLSADRGGLSVDEAYRGLTGVVADLLSETLPADINAEEMTQILGSKDYSRTVKAEKINELLNIDKKNKKLTSIVKMISGLKVDTKNIFEEDFENISFSFSDFGFDDKEADIIQTVGDKNYELIDAAHQIYNIGALAGILRKYEYLSEARVADYEKHNKDLTVLKKVVKKYGKQDDYDALFRVMKEGNYSAYVGWTKVDGNVERRNVNGRKWDDLKKTIKSYVSKYPADDKDVKYILDEVDKDSFLPKQLTSANGVIPNQVHTKELKKILDNASMYLEFLNDVDDSGLSVKDRIIKLYTFQIPYYIGPVTIRSEESGGNGWVVRKEKGKVLPWNYEDKIDVAKTSERFVERLIRECSYLRGEKVLPKDSLIYQRFCVLNEINNIKILGEKIPVQLKQDIYNDLFETGKRITRKMLSKYLINRGIITTDSELSGIDDNINNALTTYGKFLPVFGEKIKEDQAKNMIEDIVKMSTIYGDSKPLLKKYIQDKYGDRLTDEQIKRILGYKFKDWGNLSKEFLELHGCHKGDGEVKSLILSLWETNYNLMELINSDEYTYRDELENRRESVGKTLCEFEFADMDDMYFSAPVKRMVWQTVLIIRELTHILGNPPSRLFVEMTRKEDEKKERKESRKSRFLELYKSESKEWKDLIEKSDESGKLKSKKMYLYLTQMGKCMYTGEQIELDDLFNDNLYDIDHIYPRHFVKDDNIANNLVLVKKQNNARKSDNYPIDEAIYLGQKAMWKMLRDKKMITEEKYNRLIGRNPFSEQQKADFIARQLVETAQGTKGVTELLKQLLPDTQIVYSKASNVSDFRRDRDIYKSRLVNDFHHAHDAYLNIVVGNVYFVKFTQNPLNFIQREYSKGQEYNLGRMFDRDVKRGEYVAWIASKKEGAAGTIDTVRKMLSKCTPLLTRMSFEAHGQIADATLYGKSKASPDNYIPLKSNDPKMQDVTKYGGFSSVSGAYFFLVEHEKKGKKVRTIETLPIYMKEAVESDEGKLVEYCEKQLGLINPDIRIKKIKFQSLIKKDGYYVHLSGRTEGRLTLRNATSLCIDNTWFYYIKQIENFVASRVIPQTINEKKNIELYTILCEKMSKGIFSKRPNALGNRLSDKKEQFVKLTIEDQAEVIYQILQLTKIGITSADLSKIGMASKTGTMKISKEITGINEFVLICQSVTGLFERRVNLLSV